MIELRNGGYDSGITQATCDWCKGVIGSADGQIIYGTGNSLLSVFHSRCAQARNNPSGEGPLEPALPKPQIRDND
jgi:hypothetical protein